MTAATDIDRPLLQAYPIIEHMRTIEGWFADAEADLLIACAIRVLYETPAPHRLVEVGSYCGRSTVVLASVVRAIRPDARVYAVDPHEGQVGSADVGYQTLAPTADRFRANLAAAGLSGFVEEVRARAVDVPWTDPVSLLFVDGLHDYEHVAADYRHFASWLRPGSIVAFHDYGVFPGVNRFVSEVLAEGGASQLARAGSLVALMVN